MRKPATLRSFSLRVASLVTLAAACSGPLPTHPRTFPSDIEKPKPEVVSSFVITNRGGPVDWCAAKNIIAFANERHRAKSEIYTIDPSGDDKRCITCDNEVLMEGVRRGLKSAKGRFYRTAPAWHPSCEFMAIEIGTDHFRPTKHERSPFGINHSLWLIAADGSWAEEIVSVEKNGSAMRPHFSDTGDRLFWSVREPTGLARKPKRTSPTPGSEDPWSGWHLAVADFERSEGGPALLSNRVELYKGEGGWFGSTALTGDTIWFSHTPKGQAFVDEPYRAKDDGSAREKVLDHGDSWEDHGKPSPWGSLFTYRSSRPYPYRNSTSSAGMLRIELWALTRDGERVELTRYNQPMVRTKRVLLRDYAWSPDGREIAVYTLTYEARVEPRRTIEILRLNDAF